MSICPVTQMLLDNWMPLIKGASSPAERMVLLDLYKEQLAIAKGETTVAAVKKLIEDSSLSATQKSSLIRALERSAAGKVARGACYAASGTAGGAAVGAVGSLIFTAVAAGSASGATVGPAGVVIGAAGGLAVGLALALAEL